MKINYTVHHQLFDHEIIKDLKGKSRIVTWMVWCQIIHLAYFTKSHSCSFYQGQFSEDLGISQNTTRAALQLLIDKKMIKCTLPYQRKTNTPGTYMITGACIRIAHNLYQNRGKPVSPGDTVNNINNIKKKKDGVDTPPPSVGPKNNIKTTGNLSWQ